jgi:hypothetical protein
MPSGLLTGLEHCAITNVLKGRICKYGPCGQKEYKLFLVPEERYLFLDCCLRQAQVLVFHNTTWREETYMFLYMERGNLYVSNFFFG